MLKISVKNVARVAAAAGLGLSLAFTAAPVVAMADEVAPVETPANDAGESSTVEISTTDELVDAIEGQNAAQNLAGKTVVLKNDIALHATLNIKAINNLVIDGQGYTITAAGDFNKDEYGQLGLVKPENCNGITIKNVKIVATSATERLLDIYDCDNVSLENVIVDNSAGKKSPLIINQSHVTINGQLNVVTGPNNGFNYAIDVDARNAEGGASLSMGEKGNLSIAGDGFFNGVQVEKGGTASLGDSWTESGSTYKQYVATVGEKSFTTFEDAVEAALNTDEPVELNADVYQPDWINLAIDAQLTINGNGHTISFDGADPDSKTIFTGHPETGEIEGVPSGVKLTVNNVTFKNISNKQAGYAVLVGSNSLKTEVSLNGCTFKNLYTAVYVNQFTDAQKVDNRPQVSITGSTYVSTAWGYSVDTTTPGAIATGWDDAFTFEGNTAAEGQELPGQEEFAGESAVVVLDANGSIDQKYSSFADALEQATEGQTIFLNDDVTVDGKIELNKGVNIDGNGKAISLVEGVSVSTGGLIDVFADNVSISNLTVNALNAKHGVQFYRVEGGTIDNCSINGGYFTSVNVNGSKVDISNTTLNPQENGKNKPYANIEYGMGGGVTAVPFIKLYNVKGSNKVPLVYVDAATMKAVAENSDPKIDPKNTAAIVKKINENLRGVQIYLNEDGTGATSDKPATPPAETGDHAVKVEQAEGGKVSVTPTTADEGDKVTITATPDKGQEVKSVTVTTKDGKKVKVSEGDKANTWTFEMPDAEVTVKVEFGCDGGELCPTNKFDDVDADAWYHDAVDWAVEEGLLSGYEDGTLGPDGTLSRAQLATVLWRQAGEPAAKGDVSFADCGPEAFYAEAVAWADEQGIIEGYGDGTNFGPEDPVTREQLATILWRQAGEPDGKGDLSKYPDGDEATDYAVPALEWAVDTGVLSGFGDGSLAPGGVLSRAMLAAMLQRMGE